MLHFFLWLPEDEGTMSHRSVLNRLHNKAESYESGTERLSLFVDRVNLFLFSCRISFYFTSLPNWKIE